jgi:RimJ/RimL family protein N-acetyltransferase
MKFQIRNTSAKDIDFYKHCLDNSEFRWNLYGKDNAVNWDKFLSNEEKSFKFVISKIETNKVEDVAFCHFYYNRCSNDFGSIGGVAPKFFNSGMGLYAGVVAFSFLFESNSDYIFRTAVFKYNQRALKAWEAIGFKPIDETSEKIILINNYAQFYNEFVCRILKRIKINRYEK